MKSLMIMTLSVFMVVVCATGAEIGDRIRITEQQDTDGKRTFWFTTREVLSKCPMWTPATEPPLSIPVAVKKAKGWIKSKHPTFNVDDVCSVTLGRVWDTELKDRWYYTVSVNAKADVDGLPANHFFHVIVLMDGGIPEPTDKE